MKLSFIPGIVAISVALLSTLPSVQAQEKSLEDVLTLMANWKVSHPDFCVHTDGEEDGAKHESTYVVNQSRWKCKMQATDPVRFTAFLFSCGTNDFLTYFPRTKLTVRDDITGPDDVNLSKLADWRTRLSVKAAAEYGFDIKLQTNTVPYCVQITKKGSKSMLQFLVGPDGRIEEEVTVSKDGAKQRDSFKNWDFDKANVAKQFEAIRVKAEVDNVDLLGALTREITEETAP